MCNNPELGAATNSAKCASVGAMIAGILACLGFLVGGWLAGIGGILGIIAASMLLCCGPSKKGEGKGMHTASLVLYILAAILAIAGLALALSAYFNVLAAAKTGCAMHTDSQDAEDSCVGLVMGLTGILIWPAVILAAVSAAMDIWGAVAAGKAMKAITEEMSGGGGGIQFSTGAVTGVEKA